MKAKKLLVYTVVLILLFVVVFFVGEFTDNYFVRLNMNLMPSTDSRTRLMVVAPHSDDEVLGAGMLIKKTIENGGKVLVILMTNGDGFKQAIEIDYANIHPQSKDYINFGYVRQKETINALKKLGLSENDVIFLGYPDGGLSNLWIRNWDERNTFYNLYTKTNKSPYYNSYTKSVLYDGQNVVRDLENIIKQYEPNYIIFPHPNDNHPDHWATNCFVKYALTDLNYKRNEFLYLVHRGDWPTPPRRDSSLYLVPPAKLMNNGTDWYTLDMNNKETELKDSAIHMYKSQIKVLSLLMDGFIRKNELFGQYPNKSIKYRNKDDEIIPNSNNRVIIDPKQDMLKLKFNKDADIVNIYAEISKEGNLHIFLETDDEISKYIEYNFNMLLFDEKIKRIFVTLERDRIKMLNKDQMIEENKIVTKKNRNIIQIIITKEIINKSKHIFINSTTSINGHLLDHTAWRMLDVEQ